MKSKDKRIKVLERELTKTEKFSAFVILLLMISLGFMVYYDNKANNFEQQLQSCQEKVPLWILEVECYYPNINYYGMETFGYNVVGSQNLLFKFESYKDYSSALEVAESDKYCEVIK